MDSEPLTYHYSKRRLPPGQSYPLKRSDLDDALMNADVHRFRSVSLWEGSPKYRLVLHADLVPDHLHMASAGTTALYVKSVPSGVRHDVRVALLDGGVATVVEWLAQCESATETWRFQRRNLYVHYRTVVHGDEPLLDFTGDLDVPANT